MKVGIVSPSGLVENIEALERGLSYLKNNGLEPIVAKHVLSRWWYMAGDDKSRAQDMMEFFENPEVEAIICTRGGAGATRILPYLDFDIIAKNPKPVIGLSDTTAIQNAILAQSNIKSLTGFLVIYDFIKGTIGENTEKSLKAIINNQNLVIKSGETVNSGVAEGILVGGCLSVFRNLFGTKYMPDLSAKIVLIEDVGEKPYKIDAMLTHLRQQPNFDKIKGIIFGKFANCVSADAEDGTIDDVIAYFCQDIKIPIIKNFEYGHIENRYVLPIGAKLKLDAEIQSVFITSPDIFQAV